MQATDLAAPPPPPHPPAPSFTPPASLPRWALAIRTQFFVLGTAAGIWGAQVPAAKHHYGLNEQELSIALLAAATGAVACLFTAGTLVSRFGARRCSQAAGLLLCAALIGVLQFHSYAVLLVLMLAFGAGSALFDVAMNTEGNHLETSSGRKVMSGLHAMFSLGGMSGALLCAGLHKLGVAAMLQMVGIALLLAPIALLAGAQFSADRTPGEAGAPTLVWPRGLLLWMGLLTSIGMVAEGAMYDWSALYVTQELLSSEATGALAFAAFSAAMALGRLGGDWVRERMAAIALVRASGALAAVGMAIALITSQPWLALLGFMLVGLGLANIVPVMFAAAAHIPGVSAATGVAAVSAVGYVGFMVGPALIGFVARASSLTIALWVVAGFAVTMAAAARHALHGRD